jgi:hypothetical protein
LPVNYLSRRLRIPSRSGSHVESRELVPVGSSYVLVRVGSGRSVLSLQGRELGGIFDKGELWYKGCEFSTRRSTDCVQKTGKKRGGASPQQLAGGPPPAHVVAGSSRRRLSRLAVQDCQADCQAGSELQWCWDCDATTTTSSSASSNTAPEFRILMGLTKGSTQCANVPLQHRPPQPLLPASGHLRTASTSGVPALLRGEQSRQAPGVLGVPERCFWGLRGGDVRG